MRLARLEAGNPGKPEIDWKSLGEDVYELKIHEGVGYRVYFAFSGAHIILLLLGGAKPK
jgi:putative addiction module killer protein